MDAPRQRTRTGIPSLPEVVYGSHLCLFYHSPEDLLEVLAPYVQAGLAAHELCVVVGSHSLPSGQIQAYLADAIPDLGWHAARGAVEFLDARDAYGGSAAFDAAATLAFWRRKAEDAHARGFSGVRLNGDEAWLELAHWKDFAAYESLLHRSIDDLPALILCAYPMAGRTAEQVLDVASAHHAVIARRDGAWEVLELADVSRARRELQRLGADLDRRVLERTHSLVAANERLNAEIRERTRVERALRESEERFAKMFRSGPIVVGLTAASDDRILEINDAFARTFGYDRADAIGRSASELGIWASARDREHVLALVKAQGALHGYEMHARSRSGAPLDLLLFTERITIGGEQCLMWVAHDQTAKKRAERALVDQQSLLNQSERLSHTGSWQWCVEEGWTIWSRELYAIHGQTAETFTPSVAAWLALLHPEDRARVKAAVDRCIATSSAFSVEHRIVRPTGETRYVRSAGLCEHNPDARQTRLTGYATDITDQKYAEQALVDARRELEALSRKLVEVQEAERRALSRELHVRVGQDLTAMGISLALLRKRLAEQAQLADRDDVLGRLEDVTVLLEGVMGSVEDVVSGLRPTILDELGLAAALEWYANDFSARTGIKVIVAHGEPINGLPQGSELALFRIAQEALTNVAKHAKAQMAEIQCVIADKVIHLTICDDGIGPVARSPSEEERDRGFGLAIMRERARALRGTFHFGSRAQGGSCVVVRLPLASGVTHAES
jgi:two-component system sensor histidine kinase UhpB